jgi:GTP diphosphokinase / guanosine-3',5'-bis(diphosphate) 3'-diphosphatase
VSAEQWSRVLDAYGQKSKQDVLADIGQGKRLSFVVAQALLNQKAGDNAQMDAVKPGPITLRGVEGVAIQYAKCCRPIPGDSIVGVFRPGQGLVVHTADCFTLRKSRPEAEQMLEMTWADQVQGTFGAGVRILVANQKGLLARLATEIADADANIEHISMERPDTDSYVNVFFEVAVENRRHLANVMRALRHIPEVKRVQRART